MTTSHFQLVEAIYQLGVNNCKQRTTSKAVMGHQSCMLFLYTPTVKCNHVKTLIQVNFERYPRDLLIYLLYINSEMFQ